jgi:hypothetical protein
MPDQGATTRLPVCTAPEINRKITAYCFGPADESDKRLTESDRHLVEAHLLECECCWQEVRRLEAAVRVLDTDRSLLQTLTPTEVASAFGLSGKLDWPFGGHWLHALIACGLYAALYAVALLVEVAYQFDRYGRAAVWVAMAVFCWIFLTSLGGLAADWKLTLAGSIKGLIAAIAVFWLAAIILFAGACLFLPGEPITESKRQAYPAQAAYLKTIGYFLVLKMIFLLPTFHFVLVMQREMRAGRHHPVLSLLNRDRQSVRPRGVIFPKVGILVLMLVVVIAISLFLHHNLMDNLKPASYMNLFSNLILTRLVLYYLLGAACLYWYYQALDELKRECLIAERLSTRGWGESRS